MNFEDIKRKLRKVNALFVRFVKKPEFTYDDYKQFEFEKKRGIKTRGFIKETDLGIPIELEPVHYVPGGNIYLTKLLKKLNIENTDSIIDLGCGLGSPMFYFSKFPFRKIIGLEFSEKLYTGCKRNIERFNDPRLYAIYGDAGNFNSYDEFNYVFMANPFGLSTMSRVINKICHSYHRNPRIITLIYKNPVYDKEIINTKIFKRIAEFKTESSFKFFVYRTI
jgi:hypothetical protein